MLLLGQGTKSKALVPGLPPFGVLLITIAIAKSVLTRLGIGTHRQSRGLSGFHAPLPGNLRFPFARQKLLIKSWSVSPSLMSGVSIGEMGIECTGPGTLGRHRHPYRTVALLLSPVIPRHGEAGTVWVLPITI
jgi:hypothetical protein